MRIIGIIVAGLSSFTLLLSGTLMWIYEEELMRWSATPPIWIWWVVIGIFLFGVIGFFIALLGEE